MTWLPATAPGATAFERVFGLRPNLYQRYREFAELFWSLRAVEPALLELCRVRVAQLLGDSGLDLHAGLTEGKIAALAEWRTAGLFSDVERACLAFTEKFVLDPHGLSDADAAAVAAHLSAKEMVALTEALALFDGFTRFRLILGIDGSDHAA